MFHTIETNLKLTSREYNYYKEVLYENSKGKSRIYKQIGNNGQNLILHCELLKSNGIHIKLAHFSNNDFSHFFLILIVNPKRVLGNEDFISVTHESDLTMLYAKINNYLNEIGINAPFEYFSIERIDYCYNYAFLDELVSSRFMELLKKGALLNDFEIPTYYSNVQKRRLRPEDAIYARNGSVTINIYNKHAQMLKCYPYEGNCLDEYRGILRFEIQCNRPKVRGMRYSNGLPDMNAFHWMTEYFSEKTLLFYVKKIFCKGDFWTLQQARQIVQCNNFRDSTKYAMIYLLDESNKKRSLSKALDNMLAEGFHPDYLSRLLKKFDDINVNPVTIPTNWGFSHFDSPLRIILQAIDDIQQKHVKELL
ncbi:MAG: hypothetical protein FWB80_09245 [Defluviitaleaceae bacterium]|nr:hypothetical protein [Defluviitaleaceae bacterium]